MNKMTIKLASALLLCAMPVAAQAQFGGLGKLKSGLGLGGGSSGASIDTEAFLGNAVREYVSEAVLIAFQDPIDAGAGGPHHGRFGVEARARLVRRVPGTARADDGPCPDITGNLQTLDVAQAVEFRPLDDRAYLAGRG